METSTRTWWQDFLTDLIDNDTLIIGGLLILTAVYTLVTKDKDLAPLVCSGLIGYMGKALKVK